MITEEWVRIAILVLKSYVDGTLETNQCDELDAAVMAAWDVCLEDTYDDLSEEELLDI